MLGVTCLLKTVVVCADAIFSDKQRKLYFVVDFLNAALNVFGAKTLRFRAGSLDECGENDLVRINGCALLLDFFDNFGALIVFEQQTGLQDVIETGTRLNAEISAPLLENIFEPNTPLHDGAVVIREREIMAAACILPLAEASGVSRELGTRHRAALGISENTDAIVLVVSEETGIVSMAKDGTLTRPLTVKALEEILNDIYSARKSKILTFLKTLKNEAEGEDNE